MSAAALLIVALLSQLPTPPPDCRPGADCKVRSLQTQGAATASLGACAAAQAGRMRYDTSTLTLKFCNGTAWGAIGGVSSLSAALPLRSSGGATPALPIDSAGTADAGVVTTGDQEFAGKKKWRADGLQQIITSAGGEGSLRIYNTNDAGYSQIQLRTSGDVEALSFGYGNYGVPAPYASRSFIDYWNDLIIVSNAALVATWKQGGELRSNVASGSVAFSMLQGAKFCGNQSTNDKCITWDGTNWVITGAVSLANSLTSSGNLIGGTVTGTNGVSSSVFLRPIRVSLPTCAAGNEGALANDVLDGLSTGNRTQLCLCTSDGAANYAWQNVVTGTVGTASTCST